MNIALSIIKLLVLIFIYANANRVLSYDVIEQRAKFVDYPLEIEFNYLSSDEYEFIKTISQINPLISEIYLRQINPENPKLRNQLLNSQTPHRDIKLELFDIHFGPWDSLADYHPFYGDQPRPPGAGFYPETMQRTTFEAWLAKNPQDKAAFTSPYTVIRRQQGKLTAIPYSQMYEAWLLAIGQILEQSAKLIDNSSLSHYLTLRAQSLLNDDYVASEKAWLEVDHPAIDVVVGPYEMYADKLFGYKTAFQSAILLIDPQESQRLKQFKAHLLAMEANLPVADKYKNLLRVFKSPVIVADMVQSGGYLRVGVPPMAFNLPNDKHIQETHGTKNILLKNIMAGKFQYVLLPLAKRVLNAQQALEVTFESFFYQTVFHELSHALGPGTQNKAGQETTVAQRLKELHWTLEEAKADTAGIYNTLFMLNKKILTQITPESLLTTYFAGLLRQMRFGINDTASRSAALQYNFLKQKKAFDYQQNTQNFILNYSAMRQATQQLLSKILALQGESQYQAVKDFLSVYITPIPELNNWFSKIEDIPVDIKPIYPQLE